MRTAEAFRKIWGVLEPGILFYQGLLAIIECAREGCVAERVTIASCFLAIDFLSLTF
jgi:hypothetical protein